MEQGTEQGVGQSSAWKSEDYTWDATTMRASSKASGRCSINLWLVCLSTFFVLHVSCLQLFATVTQSEACPDVDKQTCCPVQVGIEMALCYIVVLTYLMTHASYIHMPKMCLPSFCAKDHACCRTRHGAHAGLIHKSAQAQAWYCNANSAPDRSQQLRN